MADIVDRLRKFGPDWTAKQTGVVVPYEVCVDAANEIERLRAALRFYSTLSSFKDHGETADAALRDNG